MRAKFVNEKFSETGDPIHDMGIGTFVKKKYDNPTKAAKYMYSVLDIIIREDEIPDDIIYPLGSVSPDGSAITFNKKYHHNIFDFVTKYVNGDLYFRAETLRELHKILLMAGYPKDK